MVFEMIWRSVFFLEGVDNLGLKRKWRFVDEGSIIDEEGDVLKMLYECRFCNMWFVKL